MQKCVSQPSDKLYETFDVAKWNEVTQQYDMLETSFPNEYLSREMAKKLNDEYE